ncbi:hypothetical protein [Cerasicoccus frondis]|uniref:hypothetical protein n=1 Tax=Cerasicoccus frondis TaxID=490090 RepID=UPI002852AD63|nr:hypothetical protein [Cerasicoccus frondis]
MAIVLEANYSKKLGLPQYSSHQYSITVRTELNDLSQVERASSALYRQLQEAVDRDIQATGFLPGVTESQPQSERRQEPAERPARVDLGWACSPKQKALIERLMREHGIEQAKVDDLARSRFRTSLENLNKMQASGLIEELISTYGSAKGKARS